MKNSRNFALLSVLLLAITQMACVTGSRVSTQTEPKSKVVVGNAVSTENTLAGALFGKVVDKSTGEVLPAAHLMSIAGVQASPCASTGGFNMKDVPAGLYKIKCTYPGYKPVTGVVEINNAKTTVVTFELVASN
jgi:hypothetical protein